MDDRYPSPSSEGAAPSPASQRSGARRWLGNLGRLLLIGGGLSYAFWDADFVAIGEALTGYSGVAVAGTLAWTGLMFLALGYRLASLGGWRFTTLTGTAASLLCQGFNLMLPSKLGEVAKVIYLAGRSPLNYSDTLALVFWERFFDLNALLLFLLPALALYDEGRLLWPLLLAIPSIWLALILGKRFPQLADRIIAWLPTLVALPLARLRKAIVEGATPRRLLTGTLQTLIFWGLSLGQLMLVLWWIADIDIEPLHALAVFTVATLGLAIPSTPGGLGVFEAAMVAALGWFGISQAEALGAAIMMRLLIFVPSIIFTLILLSQQDLGLRKLFKDGNEGRGS